MKRWISLLGLGLTLVVGALPAVSHADPSIVRFRIVAPESGEPPGLIIRGSEPKNDDDYRVLVQNRVKTVVDLRWGPFEPTGAEAAREKQLGIKHVAAPINDITGLLFEPSEGTINLALETISNPDNWPVYLHCTYGRDRTGLVTALYRVQYQGWTPQAAFQEWTSLGFDPNEYRGYVKYFWDHARDKPACR